MGFRYHSDYEVSVQASEKRSNETGILKRGKVMDEVKSMLKDGYEVDFSNPEVTIFRKPKRRMW